MIGLAGWSGSGKTTLLCRLLPIFTARGLTVSTLKHAHHGFDVDQEGKDSWAHRAAGAREVLVASSRRFALMHELRGGPELSLAALLGRMGPADLVLVEGFKREAHPKIEVHRRMLGKPLLYPDDPAIVAIATDVPIRDAPLPLFRLDDAEAIASFALERARSPHEIPFRTSATASEPLA